MKIEADVLGVEQAVDFNTMKTEAFVVLEVLGAVVRAPISEEQMEQLTIAAVRQRQLDVGDAFAETHEQSAVTPTSLDRFDDQPEREFSVMAKLGDQEVIEGSPDSLGLFGDNDAEQAKVEQLRQRPPLAPLRPVAPVAQASSGLPQLPGFGGPIADDDFQQG